MDEVADEEDSYSENESIESNNEVESNQSMILKNEIKYFIDPVLIGMKEFLGTIL